MATSGKKRILLLECAWVNLIPRLMGLPFIGHRRFKAPAIPHHKRTVIIPIPLASKRQKSSRGCPNKCFNSGENPKLIRQALDTNIKAFSLQKKLVRSSVWQASTM